MFLPDHFYMNKKSGNVLMVDFAGKMCYITNSTPTCSSEELRKPIHNQLRYVTLNTSYNDNYNINDFIDLGNMIEVFNTMFCDYILNQDED